MEDCNHCTERERVRVYKEKDASLKPLRGKNLCVIGFGSQGRAQAEILRAQGLDVTVALRRNGKSWKAARKAGFKVREIPEAVAAADFVLMLIPDEVMAGVYVKKVEPHLKKNACVCFAHGFNVTFKLIRPRADLDVVLVAPNALGAAMTARFGKGKGVPATLAVHQDATGNAWGKCLALAKGIGCTKAGCVKASFEEETFTDLFSEQTVIVGGIASLIKAGFETMVKAGYSEEVAYLCTLYEARLLTQVMQERGIEGLMDAASNTAEYGARTVGPRVINDASKNAMKAALKRVESGAFVKEFLGDRKAGFKKLGRLRARDKKHVFSRAQARLRKRFE